MVCRYVILCVAVPHCFSSTSPASCSTYKTPDLTDRRQTRLRGGGGARAASWRRRQEGTNEIKSASSNANQV